jgi:putative N6-adenine-specific DNA methylase
MKHELFAVCAPGLEPFTEAELRALGAGEIRAEPGGVAFRGDWHVLYAANLLLRTATRVLVRLGEFHARDFEQLRRRSARLDFESCLRPGAGVRITVSCSHSRLRHTGAVAERVRLAIADRLGGEPPLAPRAVDGNEDEASKAAKRPRSEAQPSEARPNQPQGSEARTSVPLVLVRLVHDRCVVSIDASGALLHQRGWRKPAGKAPLRETLAAALVLASGWDARSPLADPFCGSGSIAIEAALLARQLAPGRGRGFAFMQWPGFDAALWSRVQAEAEAAALGSAPAIHASDRDAGAIGAARANAASAGVANDVELACRAISDFVPPAGTGWIVSNPPYGVRLRGGGDLRDLYARFGAVLRQRCPGWRVALLCSDSRLVRASELALASRASWRNGGLRVEVFTGVVPGAA